MTICAESARSIDMTRGTNTKILQLASAICQSLSLGCQRCKTHTEYFWYHAPNRKEYLRNEVLSGYSASNERRKGLKDETRTVLDQIVVSYARHYCEYITGRDGDLRSSVLLGPTVGDGRPSRSPRNA